MEKLVENALAVGSPFVIYCKPNEDIRYGWFQKGNHLNKTEVLNDSCFVFAPFSGSDKIVFYPKECEIVQDSEPLYVDFTEDNVPNDVQKIDGQFHKQLVSKGIDAIVNGNIKKVVLSRKEQVTVDPFNYQLYFKRFLKKYPNAFVYWFNHPEVGMWMGATPEQLVRFQDNKIQTVALAGTMVDKGFAELDVQWGLKEIDEQQIVTAFIVDALAPYVENTVVSKPYTFKAGTLLHIKTDVEAEVNRLEDYAAIVDALHPTPALCGYPKAQAKEFILANEGYDREYYGGYLGEWKFNNLDYSNNSDLFVNLRCMKIQDDNAYLYLGGGINKNSDPESEFYETVNKSKTVKSIL